MRADPSSGSDAMTFHVYIHIYIYIYTFDIWRTICAKVTRFFYSNCHPSQCQPQVCCQWKLAILVKIHVKICRFAMIAIIVV